jgi:hypothetical protein
MSNYLKEAREIAEEFFAEPQASGGSTCILGQAGEDE